MEMEQTFIGLSAQTWVNLETFYSIRLEVGAVSLQGVYNAPVVRKYTAELDVKFEVDSSGYLQASKIIDGITYRLIFT